MPFDHLLVETDGPVATITVNRPEVLNALNAATLGELDRALRALGDDDGVRAVVLTGAGEKAFVAGADVTELAALAPGAAKAHAAFGQGVFDRIEHLGKPVIAAINGFALGGGCELAMACTIRIAANAPLAVRYAIEAVTHGLETSSAEGRFVEASLFGLSFATEDVREGTRAFIEKRKPEFKGR